MNKLVLAAITLLGTAQASACTLRLGYVDQHRPPYYMGVGRSAPPAPGASPELLREIAASGGCSVVVTRLPMLRLRAALEAGQIDAIPLDVTEADLATLALPKTPGGKLDRTRALNFHTVVFVRSSDKLARSTDPASYFQTHPLGMNYGAAIAAQLRASGLNIDDGALDSARNIEKLFRNRVDGYAVALVSMGDMDATVARQYGDKIMRLDKPVRINHIWLAVNKQFYQDHAARVDTMWNWIGSKGAARFAELVAKYERAP